MRNIDIDSADVEMWSTSAWMFIEIFDHSGVSLAILEPSASQLIPNMAEVMETTWIMSLLWRSYPERPEELHCRTVRIRIYA